jgi:transposase
METFVKLQKAKDAEEELRAIVIATRGYSAWGELQEIRARTRRERKEREDAARKRKQEVVEKVVVIGGTLIILSIITGIATLAIMSSKGML